LSPGLLCNPEWEKKIGIIPLDTMAERQPLPDKIYYSIGEIARHFGVSTSLIRYWEDEFPHITPRKNGKGDRRYNKSDIEKVARIYELIKEKGFTIKGAQGHLVEKTEKVGKSTQTMNVAERLLRIRTFLLELKKDLENI
jgi:DNA-binding transcriptional MerR regulator